MYRSFPGYLAIVFLCQVIPTKYFDGLPSGCMDGLPYVQVRGYSALCVAPRSRK